jgi:cytochrome P450
MPTALLTFTTGIPHAAVKDDIYEGYHIPAGSVMHPLEWSISRDPEIFHDPDVWNPMRWLESKYPTFQEPLSKYPTITSYSQFGYGRRTCQGMGVTEADLFVGLGSMAWMFSMHADTEDVEHETDLDRTQAELEAERKYMYVQSANTRPQTPPNEEDIAQELFDR